MNINRLYICPSSYTHLSTDPTHHLKRHPDPISRFSTDHPPDRPTDRQTDRWSRRQLCSNTRLYKLYTGCIATRITTEDLRVYGAFLWNTSNALSA